MLVEWLSVLLKIAEQAIRLWAWLKGKRQVRTETITERFIRLFESHNVHRNQIPRFFGQGLTLQDVQSDTALMAKLDEAVLQAACDLFAVRREWLDGAEPAVYACHDFYKSPELVGDFLETLRAANPDGDLYGVVFAPESADGEALIVLYETVGWVGDKAIYRYHLLHNWTFSYWKARAYLAACVAIAWKHGVYLRGEYLASADIAALADGSSLIGEQDQGIYSYGGRKWYPEDMAIKPEVFLEGVDPERDNFGVRAALGLWLELDAQGFMNPQVGSYDRADIRAAFVAAQAG